MKTIISLILFLQLNSFAQNDSTLKHLGYFSYMNYVYDILTEGGVTSWGVDRMLDDLNDINQLYTNMTVHHEVQVDSVDLYSITIYKFLVPDIIFMWALCDSTYYSLESNLEDFISSFLLPCDNLTEEQAMKIISFYNKVEFKDYKITLLPPDWVASSGPSFEEYNKLLDEGSVKRVIRYYKIEPHSSETIEEYNIQYYFTKNKFSVEKYLVTKK